MPAIMFGVKNFFASMKNSFDNALVKYDAWFTVLLAVLLVLAFTIFAALSIWCVVYKGMKFTGDWGWKLKGISLNVECK